ncbi:hypothetical protein AU156_gp275 [Edwardsiella phage PEi20]|uniref:Uncharacterized protein n=1 Tax=Edwardsiella phage PEi20 TaxID=1608310 RepID=A0A0B6VSS1_9CAUD|nr:hypothetical protein AU156_gp275 [Edwardsiella phage PEi20]BAQ22825.1 hypothetical protein [Edwardsiella phage PEi20]
MITPIQVNSDKYIAGLYLYIKGGYTLENSVMEASKTAKSYSDISVTIDLLSSEMTDKQCDYFAELAQDLLIRTGFPNASFEKLELYVYKFSL